jgi:hypothetical protein
MILPAALGVIAVAITLAGLYDLRVRRTGARAHAIEQTQYHLGGCQQQVFNQPHVGRDTRR